MWNPISGESNSAKSYGKGLVKLGRAASGYDASKRMYKKYDLMLGAFVVRENGDFNFTPSKIKALYNEKISDGEVNFKEVVTRLKLSKDDLSQRRKQYTLIAKIYFALSLIFIAFGSHFGMFSIVSCLGVTCIPLSLWHRYSHKAYQIRVSSLCSVKEWMSQPKWWAEAFISTEIGA